MKKTVCVFLTVVALLILGLAHRKNQPASAAIANVPAAASHDAPGKQNVAVAAPASIADKSDHPVAANPPASRPAAAIIQRGGDIASPQTRRVNEETNAILFHPNPGKIIDPRQVTVIVGG